MRHYSLITVLVLAAAGCSPQNDEPAAAKSADEPQHVWKEQVQTLDKARQVEDTLMDAQQRRAESLPE
jgi:hypothetical protein